MVDRTLAAPTASLMNAPYINIYAYGGVDLIVDITGYDCAAATDPNGGGLLYTPLPIPIRLLDTRPGSLARDAPGEPLTGGTARMEQAVRTCFGVTIPAESCSRRPAGRNTARTCRHCRG
jgi:hypothetical protein